MATSPSSSSVNTSLSAPNRSQPGDETTPTTPKPNARFSSQPPKEIPAEESAPNTPTRDSFAGVPGQRALPNEPLTSVHTPGQDREEARSLQRDGSYRSTKSQHSAESDDVEMADGDMDEAAEDEGSDNESVTSDSQRPSKKKKGQRFFCTDFPPCQLSFTRSEHLARHIRKHTGERPFQCHCSRRFSRLDNLRQHAQTVHVNEEIPGDSLAATSTRFQRQIRTDRVRPPAGRSRTNTIGSQAGGHSRGHSRNLSSSSIGSTASSVGIPEDTPRRRPAALAMAGDGSKRAMLSVDTFNAATGSPGPQYTYYNQSPTGYSTPTSTTFSVGTASPGMASPSSTISRSSFYNGARHGRRLSVPSGNSLYQNSVGGTYQPIFFSPNSPSAVPAFSQNSSVFASPTTSVFSQGRRDSETELEYRRRTWHSGTHPGYTQRPATSGLMYGQTPDEPRPALSSQPAASQVTRLPGIESFDHAPPPAARQQSSPMMIDAQPRPHSSHRPSDAGLHHNLTRLDITSANAPPPESAWQNSQPVPPPQPSYFVQQPVGVPPQYVQPNPTSAAAEQPTTPRRNKRQAWYGGPVGPTQSGRPSPEDSGSSDGVPTPLTQQGVEYHPLIVNPNEPYPPHAPVAIPVGGSEQKSYIPAPQHVQAAQRHTYALQAGHDPRFASSPYMHPPSQGNNDMGRLEALVAVATSEDRALESRR